VRAGEHRIGPGIAFVWEEDGDAGAYVRALDERRMPDPDAANVRDRVALARRQVADADAEIPGARFASRS